ncbi:MULTISPECIES: pirin family protein [Halomonas]|uniref:pirin family protein n=1 Tax=Halomonas TaxID=2745 RepID=UPI001A8C0754|nr:MULTISPECIES: pirin family protein [Halomonas]MBN8414089.1 pirin family protein [Halomonas litopenaei]MBY5930739.1 pirin family protein [Halomonas sp. DP8Y7-3]MBY5970461.1 pirin family protein [Halomonas denitrificans]
MSLHETPRRPSSSRDCPVIDGRYQIQRIGSREAAVGGLPIHRVLPTRHRRTIGAWCFLDHAGPSILREGEGMRVGPHPHTSLQTFTWMLSGEVHHRDSLGSDQVIRPGEVNLMTAGHGISHTEESLEDSDELHAAQLWIALPLEHADTAPRFDHYADLPRWSQEDVHFTLLVGHYGGHDAPTLSFSPLVGVDLQAERSAQLTLPLQAAFEYGVLVLEGDLTLDGESFKVDELAYLGRGRNAVDVTLSPGSRMLLIGGEPLEDEIVMWWNFVAHSRKAIIEAQRDWEAESPRFGTIPQWQGPRLEAPPLPWTS